MNQLFGRWSQLVDYKPCLFLICVCVCVCNMCAEILLPTLDHKVKRCSPGSGDVPIHGTHSPRTSENPPLLPEKLTVWSHMWLMLILCGGRNGMPGTVQACQSEIVRTRCLHIKKNTLSLLAQAPMPWWENWCQLLFWIVAADSNSDARVVKTRHL